MEIYYVITHAQQFFFSLYNRMHVLSIVPFFFSKSTTTIIGVNHIKHLETTRGWVSSFFTYFYSHYTSMYIVHWLRGGQFHKNIFRLTFFVFLTTVIMQHSCHIFLYSHIRTFLQFDGLYGFPHRVWT